MKILHLALIVALLAAVGLGACASGVAVRPKGEVVVGGSMGGSTTR